LEGCLICKCLGHWRLIEIRVGIIIIIGTNLMNHFSLSTTKKIPATSQSQGFTIHYSLFTIRYSLFTLHYSLFTLHYSLFTVIASEAKQHSSHTSPATHPFPKAYEGYSPSPNSRGFRRVTIHNAQFRHGLL